MKPILSTTVLLLATYLLWAQKETPQKIVESKIETVTVYESGAQITRTAKTNLAAGRTALVLRGISPHLDKQSLQASGDFTILSVVHQTSFLSDTKKTDDRTRLETQKIALEEKITLNNALLRVYQQEEAMLIKNQDIKGSTTILKVADLKESVDFQRNRLTEVLTKQLELQKANKQIEQEIKKLNAQLTTLAPTQETTTSEIIVTVQTATPQLNADIEISYFVANAGWTPSYDIRVHNITRPLEIGYKATVYQYSGEDWNNIKLVLSTANPRKNNQAPELRPWYWGRPNDYSSYYNAMTTTPTTDNEIVGTVRSKNNNEALPGATIVLKGTSLGTTTDANGNYRINIPPDMKYKSKILIASMVGYVPREVSVYSNQHNIELAEDNRQLNEVVVTAYGVQSDGERALSGRVQGVSVKPKRANLILMEEIEAPTSQQYEIKETYSLPSDGKTYTVEIKNEEVPAYYEYFCAPKIDTDAFLTAHITNWEQYGLLGGDMNIFFEGIFVGKSAMNLTGSDTLSLSLGRDKNVIVSRIKQKTYTKKQFLGSSQTETRGYEINVRNTKKQPINIVVEDQFPLSLNKEIEVSNQTAPDATINKDNGKVSWKFSLPAAQQRKLTMSYTVKYPKSGVQSSE